MTVENHGLLYDYKIYIEYLNLYCSMLSSMNIEYKHNIQSGNSCVPDTNGWNKSVKLC